AEDLRRWLAGEAIAARPVGGLERAALFVRRRPAVAAAYGLTAAVLVLAGVGGGLARLWPAAEPGRAAGRSGRAGRAQGPRGSGGVGRRRGGEGAGDRRSGPRRRDEGAGDRRGGARQ